MDNFLFYGDFKIFIQNGSLNQIIGNDLNLLDVAISMAVELCKSNLRSKYDVSQAFQPITQHDSTKSYLSGQTVYLNAPDYMANKTYTLNTLTAYQDNVYKNTTAIATGEPFNPSHWSLVGTQYTIFTAIFPQKQFNYKDYFKVGDQTFWKDKVYTNKIKTVVLGHEDQLQRGYISDNICNAFPDVSFNRWGDGVPYSVPDLVTDTTTDPPTTTSIDITNTTYWKQGDGRDPMLLQTCLNIAIYNLQPRLVSRTMQVERVNQYMGYESDRETRGQRVLYPTYSALGWLQAAVIGNDIVPNLPKLQPDQNDRISFGGRPKNCNDY